MAYRKSLPADFKADPESLVPGLSPAGLVAIIGGTAVGGPAGGATALALTAMANSKPIASAEAFSHVTTSARNMVEMLKTLSTFVGESEIDKLQKIAVALGNPDQRTAIPTTAVANHLTRLARGVHNPGEPGADPPIPERYLVDCECEKKKLMLVAVSLTVIPEGHSRRMLVSEADTFVELGFLIWKRGNDFWPDRVFFNTNKVVCCAPHSEIDDFDYFLYPGIQAEITTGEISVPW